VPAPDALFPSPKSMAQLAMFCTEVETLNVTASGGLPELGFATRPSSGVEATEALVAALCGVAFCAERTVSVGRKSPSFA
jgi:hypothetical protein